MTFDQAARLLVDPTTNRAPVNQALDAIQAQGGTAMGDALSVSLHALQNALGAKALRNGSPTHRPPAQVVLISDGKNTTGVTDPLNVAQQARRSGIRINTVALGTRTGTVQVQDQFGLTQKIQVPPDPVTLRKIAQITGGQFFAAPNAQKLESIYKTLGSKVARDKPIKREVAYIPAVAAIALLLAAGLVSLLWFARLP